MTALLARVLGVVLQSPGQGQAACLLARSAQGTAWSIQNTICKDAGKAAASSSSSQEATGGRQYTTEGSEQQQGLIEGHQRRLSHYAASSSALYSGSHQAASSSAVEWRSGRRQYVSCAAANLLAADIAGDRRSCASSQQAEVQAVVGGLSPGAGCAASGGGGAAADRDRLLLHAPRLHASPLPHALRSSLQRLRQAGHTLPTSASSTWQHLQQRRAYARSYMPTKRTFKLPASIAPLVKLKLAAAPKAAAPVVPPLEPRPLQSTSRRTGVIAVKAGMTQEWDEYGARVPLTVLWIDDCQVRGVAHAHARTHHACTHAMAAEGAKQGIRLERDRTPCSF